MSTTAAPGRARRALVVVGVLVVLLLGSAAVAASCSPDGSEPSEGDPSSTTSKDQGGTTDPEEGPADPPDQVVWQERTSGGLVPISVGAAEVPTLTVYADGRVFLADRDSTTRYDHPVPLRSGRVSERALTDFLEEATASGLFGPDQDFGRPGVTDLPTTTVSAHLDGVTTTVEVYALEASFEEDLSDAQVDRRNGLRALLATGTDLAADAEPWTPDRVRVTDVGVVEPEATTVEPPAPWPGPPFGDFADVPGGSGERCLVVSGPNAGEVFAAASDNAGIAFVAGDEVHELVVAALLPGEAGCPS